MIISNIRDAQDTHEPTDFLWLAKVKFIFNYLSLVYFVVSQFIITYASFKGPFIVFDIALSVPQNVV
mgnify:CR=1 FL=1